MSEFDELIADLKQKRDELRVKMHLASREVQDEWQELEEKMDDFSKKAQLEETGKGLSSAVGQLGQEIKLGYERLWQAVKD